MSDYKNEIFYFIFTSWHLSLLTGNIYFINTFQDIKGHKVEYVAQLCSLTLLNIEIINIPQIFIYFVSWPNIINIFNT